MVVCHFRRSSLKLLNGIYSAIAIFQLLSKGCNDYYKKNCVLAISEICVKFYIDLQMIAITHLQYCKCVAHTRVKSQILLIYV